MVSRFAAMLALCSVAALSGSADAAQLDIVNTIPGTFTDISSTGQLLGLSNDGEVLITSTIGNGVLPAGPLVVGTNGGISFGPIVNDLLRSNQPIPSNDAFAGQQALLPFWDLIMLAPDDPKDPPIDPPLGIYFEEVFVSGVGNVAIVQWDNVAFALGGTAPGGGISATIGYQDGASGNNDVQWSFDTGSVSDGVVLSLIDDQVGTLLAQFLYFDIEQGGRDVYPHGTFQLQIMMPEPSSAIMLLSAMLLVCRRRSRR